MGSSYGPPHRVGGAHRGLSKRLYPKREDPALIQSLYGTAIRLTRSEVPGHLQNDELRSRYYPPPSRARPYNAERLHARTSDRSGSMWGTTRSENRLRKAPEMAGHLTSLHGNSGRSSARFCGICLCEFLADRLWPHNLAARLFQILQKPFP